MIEFTIEELKIIQYCLQPGAHDHFPWQKEHKILHDKIAYFLLWKDPANVVGVITTND